MIQLLSLVLQLQLPAPPRGYSPDAADIVVDAAGVLRADAVQRINRIAFHIKRKSGGELAVVTLPDLAGRTSEEIALRIGREWGIGADTDIGDRARNAGVVVLLVPKETSGDGRGYIRIETGRGAEGFITDGRAGAMRDEALPAFRAGDYSAGIELIALRVAQRYADEFGFALDTAFVAPRVERPAREPAGGGGGGGRGGGRGVPPAVVLFLIVLALAVTTRAAARKGRGGWVVLPPMYGHRRSRSSGVGGFGGFGDSGWSGGGGGFGGFGGGGGFSGGGAGGSW
ncbi:MAG: TPM domain-containing protein [Gemmatimonadaceae bacterium]